MVCEVSETHERNNNVVIMTNDRIQYIQSQNVSVLGRRIDKFRRFTSSDLSRRLPFPTFYQASRKPKNVSNFDFTNDEVMYSMGHGVTSGKRKPS